MAHTNTMLRMLESFLVTASCMKLPALAQQHLTLKEEADAFDNDEGSIRATSALINAVDAIGAAKFPDEWTNARDNAGLDQTAGA